MSRLKRSATVSATKAHPPETPRATTYLVQRDIRTVPGRKQDGDVGAVSGHLISGRWLDTAPCLEGDAVNTCSCQGEQRQESTRADENHTRYLVPRKRIALVGKLHHAKAEKIQRPLVSVLLEIANLLAQRQLTITASEAS